MSEVELAASRIASLEPSAAFWASAVLWLTGLTAFVAAMYFVATVISARRTAAVGNAKSELIAAQDRQRASERDEANRQIAEARAEAAQAIGHSAEANRIAAEAELKTEQVRMDRLELEADLSPRSLSFEAANELRAFAGTSVVITYPPDLECKNLAGQIMTVLNQSLWNVIETTENREDRFMVGITVGVDVSGIVPPELKLARTAAATLVSEMKKAGLLAMTHADNGNLPKGIIMVKVGERPSPARARAERARALKPPSKP